MQILPPSQNSVEYPDIQVFIPYTKIYPATLISLLGYNYQPVKIEEEFGYQEYFKKRWEERKTFINIEHDVVIYPGILESLWNCPLPWCVCDYHLPNHRKRNLEGQITGIPLGCVKISSELILSTPHLWDEPVEWSKCDQQLNQSQVKVHQHHPGVVNANAVFLDLLKGIEY